MADLTTMRAAARDRAGKGAARAERRAGRVPGVIYGDGKPAVLISVDPRDLEREVHKSGFFARLLTVELDGEKHRALPRDVQLHPATDRPIHVDFMRVGAATRLTVAVPVQFVDQEKSPGLRRGGILNIVRHEIDLICTPDTIPEKLIISLDGLDIGDSVHITAVALPEGTRPTIGRNFTVASVAAPTAVREEQAAAAAAATGEAEAAAPGATPAAPGAAPGAAAGAAPGAATPAAAPAAGARGGAAKQGS